MNILKSIGLACMVACLLTSCKKDDCSSDAFIFGSAFGECAGDCAHFFKLNDGKMYEDNIDNFYLSNMSFQSSPLPDAKYQVARHLPDHVPSYLVDHPGGTLGCPDCHDQGVMYLEIHRHGSVHKWKLDRDTTALPQEIRAYVYEVMLVESNLR